VPPALPHPPSLHRRTKHAIRVDALFFNWILRAQRKIRVSRKYLRLNGEWRDRLGWVCAEEAPRFILGGGLTSCYKLLQQTWGPDHAGDSVVNDLDCACISSPAPYAVEL
jgi:hypothetical protein